MQRSRSALADEIARETLALARRLLEQQESPQALQDLNLSLTRLGGVAQERGDSTSAGVAFREAHQLAYRLAQVFREVEDHVSLEQRLRAVVEQFGGPTGPPQPVAEPGNCR
jgi:hypothetical protein